MENADYNYLISTFKPLERVVQEWTLTEHRIFDYLCSIKTHLNLLDATKLILFEVLHERGFQYSLAVLKAQLDTPKWTEILLRKHKNNYYRNTPDMNVALFDELDNARHQLLAFVANARCSDQKNHIKALYGHALSVRITHFPKVEYGQGKLKEIVFSKYGAGLILKDQRGNDSEIKVSDLILAQVNPIKVTPFDAMTRRRIGSVFDKYPDAKVIVTLDLTLIVEFSNGKRADLEAHCSDVDAIDLSSSNRQYFELEQVLGSHERGETISYTQQKPTKVYIGTTHYHADSNTIAIKNDDSQTLIKLCLSEVLIDPLQKEDLTPHSRAGFQIKQN
jgi:hypothetical protein